MNTWTLIWVEGPVVTGPVKVTPEAGQAAVVRRSGAIHTSPVAACALGIICGNEKTERIKTDSTRSRTVFLLNQQRTKLTSRDQTPIDIKSVQREPALDIARVTHR
jgi:hypothetical protein